MTAQEPWAQPASSTAVVQPTDRSGQDLALQQRLLAMIVTEQPLEATLTAMCLGIEERFPGVRCTVLLVDRDGDRLVHAAGPSMHPDVLAAIDGMPVADGSGACGTAAARRDLVVIADTTAHPSAAPFRELSAAHGLRSVWSVPLIAPDGEVYGTFALYRSTPHVPDEGEVAAVRAAASLGSLAVERHHREQALRVAANQDALTGLPNRSSFMRRLQDALHGEDRVAVLFMDVDQFKLVNDTLGHRTGDELLVEMGRRLRRAVSDPHVVARFGGDEFTVLVVGGGPELADRVADDVDAAFLEPFPIPGGQFAFTASVGMADACPGAATTAEELIRDADTAMYAAKASRRTRVRFDDQLRRQVVGRMALENAMQQGLAADEFVVGYQPVIDLRTGARTSVEALVRWTHPERGTVAPGEFIELAEETGLIVPLGARVLEIAVGDVAALRRRGVDLTVAVNVSAIQLSDTLLPGHVAAALEAHDLPPERLVIELTESAALERGITPRRVLADLAAMGVRLLIDDFGTGYASIPLLRELPVVGLKVDRSFTMAVVEDARMRGVIAAITGLAHAFDLFVVAEGVDTPQALEVVRELGCDLAQGFHLSPPVTVDQL